MVGVVDVLDEPLVREGIRQALHALSCDRSRARDLRDRPRALLRQGAQDAEASRRLAHPSGPAVSLRPQTEERVRELEEELRRRRTLRTPSPPPAAHGQIDNILSKYILTSMADFPAAARGALGTGSPGQAGHPRGLVGRLFGAVMARLNHEMNRFTLEQLDVRPSDRVLEIGFGPGQLVAALAESAQEGAVWGADHSDT